MEQQRRVIVWEAQQWSSLEYLRLDQRADEIVANGSIVMVEENLPLRIRYTVRCDLAWVVRAVSVQAESAIGTNQRLIADGAGHWTRRPGGALLTSLEGCIDVDIAATPFTNTLPIRRLALQPSASAEINVAYISVPELSFRTARQRYTCLEAHPQGGRYRYEGLDSGFTAELTIDADGLVIDYQNLWKRRWPR